MHETGALPGGSIEVSRGDDDKITLSFLGREGRYHWFKFDDDAEVKKLAKKLDAVAMRAVDLA